MKRRHFLGAALAGPASIRAARAAGLARRPWRVCWSRGNFGPRVLEKAKQKGVARLALKALAHSVLAHAALRTHPKCWYRPVADRALAEQALRFTLSEDITAAIPPGDEGLYEMALELAAGFRPLSADEREALLASAAGLEPIFRA